MCMYEYTYISIYVRAYNGYVHLCVYMFVYRYAMKIPFQTLEGATACARDTLKCGVTVGTYYFLSLYLFPCLLFSYLLLISSLLFAVFY